MYSTEYIHANGTIKHNSEFLKESFSFFGLSITRYNSEFITAFLTAKIIKISEQKQVNGQFKIFVNLNTGYIDHKQNNFNNSTLNKKQIKDFIIALRKFELSDIQDKLKFFLKENFNYDCSNFTLDLKSGEFIIAVKVISKHLKTTQTIEHREKCYAFALQKSIIEHVYKLEEKENELDKVQKELERNLRCLKTQNKETLQKFAKEQEVALNKLKSELQQKEQKFQKENDAKITSIDTKFRLKNKV
jgi:hypothetical protein